MFSLIKQVFIVLFSFSNSLACIARISDRTTYMSLNDEPYMARPTLIDLNPMKIKYDPFMISLDKCNGGCNAFSSKICVLKKNPKDINVKVFTIITNKNEDKTIANIFHVTLNANLIVEHVIQIKNGITKHVYLCECKNYCSSKKDYSCNPNTRIYEHNKYLKSIVETSVTAYDEFTDVMNIVSTKMTNTIATSTVSINFDGKKVVKKVLLVTILLLIIAFSYYHYAKHR